MHKKDPRLISLRALRKTSHLSGAAARESGRFLAKVEHKTSRIIINKTGSLSGEDSIGLDEFFHQNFPFMTDIHPALPNVGQKPSVTVFAFLDPRGFYGGIATLLIVGATLANKLGYDFRVAQTTGYSKNHKVLEFLKSNGVIVPESRFSTFDLSKRTPSRFAYLPLHPEDVVVVSAWWDAHVASYLPLNKPYVYLIQDYEPIFYNNGDSQRFSEQTYHSEKFIPLCNTELVYKFLAENNYAYIQKNALWFEPAPAPKMPATKASETSTKLKKRLFLYGRPTVHRNLFFSALKALDAAFSGGRLDGSQWELFCAGQSETPSVRLSSGNIIKNLGKMDIKDYYAFAAEVDVAVSPMLAPHPNYPTLELASLGATVVSTSYETKQDLSMYSKNILLAEPTVNDMSQKIIEACLITPEERAKNYATNNISGDWPGALEKPIDGVAARLQKK